jgi:hypothetical protein
MTQTIESPAAARSKVRAYRAIAWAIPVFAVLGAVVGAVGARFCDYSWLQIGQWFWYVAGALIITGFVLRGGPSKPHLR